MTEAYLLHAATVIGTLIVLEGLLSADNALVLAVLVRNLPKPLQKKALLYGIVGAFIFRFIMLILASYIMKFWYLSAIGAGYLAYLAVKHFIKTAQSDQNLKSTKEAGFWKTVIAVELTDVAFAVDSVLVAVALSNELWLIYAGGVLGIIAMRFAAGGFLALLDKWPGLEHMAYALVAWISVKLFVQSWGMYAEQHPHLNATIFWCGMAAIALFGAWYAIRHKRPGSLEEVEEIESEMQSDDVPLQKK